MTDFDQQNDDFLDDFEGEELDSGEVSDEEYNMRRERFLKQVRQRIAVLQQPNKYSTKQRTAAARWLGESGEPQAIEPLVAVYNRADEEASVKKAAAYALGQFKALENALMYPETKDRALDNIENIMLYGKFGKRQETRNLRLTELGLVVTLVLFVGIGLVVPGTGFGTPPAVPTRINIADIPTNTPDTLEFQEERTLEFYQALQNDAEILRVQMRRVTSENTRQDCSVNFATDGAFNLSPAGQNSEELTEFVASLNAIQEDLQPVIDDYQSRCDASEGILRQEAIDYGTVIVDVQRALRELGNELGAADFEVPPTATLAATDIPQPTPTPTIDTASLRQPVATMRDIISSMTALRGPGTTIQTYWQDVLDSGSSGGCIQPPPVVPDDYVLPDTIENPPPVLLSAVEDLNFGLRLTRDSVESFYQACSNNELGSVASAGKERADLAIQSFENARQHLNELS